MGVEERGDRFRELEEAYRDYTVYDRHYERVGRVDDVFVDENDQPEYIGVKTGFLGVKSTLIPMEIARVNDRRKLVEVAADRQTIAEGPAFDDDEEITRDHEARIYGYYGLQHPGFQEGTGGYGDYYASETGEPTDDLAGAVDTEYGQRREESLHDATHETSAGEPAPEHPETTGESADEQGSVRVYKRVRTGG